jgi:Phage integrase family
VSSCTESTQKQYKCYILKFNNYCKDKNISINNVTLSNVLEFLYLLYNEGVGYSSINSARSALSLYLKPIDNFTVGNHPIINRFVKGVGKLRPPSAKYQETWDVNILLNYIETLGSNNNLSLQMLTYKMVGLLAIITAHRVQTLNSILISNITYNNNNMCIKITKMLKTYKPGSIQPMFLFPPYHNVNLCIQNTIVEYLNRTLEFRAHDELLLSFNQPHNPVSNQTVSRWLKEILKRAGINIDVFKAHSFRGASTSKAYSKGLSISDIFNRAGWENNSTCFARFYNRTVAETNDNNYTNVILS